MRTRADRRYYRNKTIIRKARICKLAYGWQWYDCPGKYAKGKIDCGCGLCKPTRRFRYPSEKNIREIKRKGGIDYACEDYTR